MKFLFAIVAFLALTAVAFGSVAQWIKDPWAVNECRKKFGNIVDLNSCSTGSGCTLDCVIDGVCLRNTFTDIPCPRDPLGRCVHGECLTKRSRIEKALSLTGRSQLGRIDVSMVSADLANFANTYMAVCIQNSTKPVTLPIKDHSQCAVSCKTSRSISSKKPFWKDFCANTSKFFVENSRVSFEIYNNRGAFMGGATITIPEVFKNKQNNKPFSLALSGGFNSGSMLVRVKYDRLN